MRLMIECWRTGQLIPARIETDSHSFEVVRRDGEDILCILPAPLPVVRRMMVAFTNSSQRQWRISGGTSHRLPVCRAPSAPRGACRAIAGSVGTLDDLDRQAVLMGPGMKLLENG